MALPKMLAYARLEDVEVVACLADIGMETFAAYSTHCTPLGVLAGLEWKPLVSRTPCPQSMQLGLLGAVLCPPTEDAEMASQNVFEQPRC